MSYYNFCIFTCSSSSTTIEATLDHDYATDHSNQKSQSQLEYENQLLRNRIKELEENESAMKRNETEMKKSMALIGNVLL